MKRTELTHKERFDIMIIETNVDAHDLACTVTIENDCYTIMLQGENGMSFDDNFSFVVSSLEDSAYNFAHTLGMVSMWVEGLLYQQPAKDYYKPLYPMF